MNQSLDSHISSTFILKPLNVVKIEINGSGVEFSFLDWLLHAAVSELVGNQDMHELSDSAHSPLKAVFS